MRKHTRQLLVWHVEACTLTFLSSAYCTGILVKLKTVPHLIAVECGQGPVGDGDMYGALGLGSDFQTTFHVGHIPQPSTVCIFC